MVMYPVQEITGVFRNVIQTSPRKIKEILKNPLNNLVTYDRSIPTKVKVYVEFKNMSPWSTSIIRRYLFDSQSFNWAIKNRHTDVLAPNIKCPRCGKYEYSERFASHEYAASFNLICNECMDEDSWTAMERIATYNICRSKKVNWAKEGF